jgi:hypothetical protein
MDINILDLALSLIIAGALCFFMCQSMLFNKNDWQSDAEIKEAKENDH